MATDIYGQNGIVALYIGYFGRAPEPDGFEYWNGRAAEGASLHSIADSFAASPEAISLYPELADGKIDNPTQFITDVYNNLFGRDPDPEGLAYWTENLAEGHTTPANFILDVLAGAGPDDSLIINNKIEVASAFVHADELSDNYTYDVNDARSVISEVDGSQSSVNHAMQEIQDHVYPPAETVEVPGDTVYVPGDTVYVNVPGPTEYVDLPHNISYDLDATMDITGSKGYAGVEPNYGDGNYLTHKAIMMDHTSGVELALGGSYRTGDQVIPVATGPNSVDIMGTSGHQTAGDHNVSVDHVGRSAMSFDFSVNAGLNDLSDVDQTFFLMVDVDPTINTNFLELQMVNVSPGVDVWVDTATNTPLISDDDGTNASLSQNSVNWGFNFLSSLIDGVGPAGSGDIPAGVYTVELQERDASGVDIIGSVRADFHMDALAV